MQELYQFADETGILERHRQLVALPGHNNAADMKIMYYELIKMLISHEHGKLPPGEEGRQELTNKLQRYLNQRFLRDVETLKQKVDVKTTEQEINNNNSTDNNISNNMNHDINRTSDINSFAHCSSDQDQKMKELQQQIRQIVEFHGKLEKDQKLLKNKVIQLENTNKNLETEIKEVRKRSEQFEKIQSENNRDTDDQLVAQTEIIKIMKTRLDRCDRVQAEQEAGLQILQSGQQPAVSAVTAADPAAVSETLQEVVRPNQENKELFRRVRAEEKRRTNDENKNIVIKFDDKKGESHAKNFDEISWGDKMLGIKLQTRDNIQNLSNKSFENIFGKIECLSKAFAEYQERVAKLEANVANGDHISDFKNNLSLLNSKILNQETRTNDASVRMTQNFMMTSNMKNEMETWMKTIMNTMEELMRKVGGMEERQDDKIEVQKKLNELQTKLDHMEQSKNTFVEKEQLQKSNFDPNELEKFEMEMKKKIKVLEQSISAVKIDTKEKIKILAAMLSEKDGKSEDHENILGTKMDKIMEQTNLLMLQDAKQEEELGGLRREQMEMARKLTSLEQADVFLQEADRMVIEKVSEIFFNHQA